MRRSIRRSLLFLLPAVLVVVGLPSPAHSAIQRMCTDVYRIQAANGYYVTAETNRADYNGMLSARVPADRLGTWEEFEVWELYDTVSQLKFYSFKAHNGKFVDAFDSYSGSFKGMLRATASTDNYNYQRFRMSSAWLNGQLVNIRSTSSSNYVAAEEGYGGTYYGMLRARTPGGSTGNWELFRFHRVRGC